jgi:hypothetical protein
MIGHDGIINLATNRVLKSSDSHLLEARYIEASRRIDIYGEIGFMKVDGIAIQKVVDTKTETDHGVCCIDGCVIRRVGYRSLIHMQQNRELAVDAAGVFQVRNGIGANRLAVVVKECDTVRLVFVQERGVVQKDDFLRCREIVKGRLLRAIRLWV